MQLVLCISRQALLVIPSDHTSTRKEQFLKVDIFSCQSEAPETAEEHDEKKRVVQMLMREAIKNKGNVERHELLKLTDKIQCETCNDQMTLGHTCRLRGNIVPKRSTAAGEGNVENILRPHKSQHSKLNAMLNVDEGLEKVKISRRVNVLNDITKLRLCFESTTVFHLDTMLTKGINMQRVNREMMMKT